MRVLTFKFSNGWTSSIDNCGGESELSKESVWQVLDMGNAIKGQMGCRIEGCCWILIYHMW